ncbi:hypothetical protein PanWU01x14_012930 [Parasponia andersonii]|uniref:Uncharacterized protein n=1 Tax=Parasponia andersonii TaxID=3476 RepID=A0A2P5E0X6_PARAD|nr:hypothetical protein PanWU01x14_012930 [Parasponia andersonii]
MRNLNGREVPQILELLNQLEPAPLCPNIEDKYTKDIMLSTIYEPSLEPNLIVTMVLVMGHDFTAAVNSHNTQWLKCLLNPS